jgi:hypothetical protein
LGELIRSVPNKIQFPAGYEDFFEETGPTSFFESDRRSSARMRVRTSGILIPRRWLPAFPRVASPLAIYTNDFSKTGFGFIAHQQWFPGEHVRVLLATFWMEIAIRRCRRLGPGCFEVGGTLIEKHDESLDAFLDCGNDVAEPVGRKDSFLTQRPN